MLAGPGSAISVPGITVVTPPSSRPFTITLSTQWTLNGTVYGIDATSLSYTCQTGTLTAVTAVPSSTSVNAVTQYSLTFTTVNALISGSFISIYFPSELTPTVGACSTNNSAISCSISNTSYALLSITGGVPSISTIKVTFPSVKNPKQAQTTSSFQIYTYYDAGLDSMVDKITSGVTMASTSNSITVASVTPTSFITYALTTYTFFAVLPDLIPANGYIKINVPPTINLGTLSLGTCSFPTGSCSIAPLNSTITISGCFSSDMASPNMTISLTNLYNPPSTQPTSSFAIYTYGPLGMVDSVTTALIATMTTPAATPAFTVAPLSSTVHTFAQYNLAFTFAVPHAAGDYMTLSIPSSMAIQASPSCSPISGIGSVSCGIINATSLKISLNAVPSASAQISILSIRNYDIATSQSFTVQLFNAADYSMETTAAASTTYTPAALTASPVNYNDQIALYEDSNLTLQVSSPFAIDSSFQANQTALTLTLPASFAVSANTTCTPAVGVCVIGNTTLTITAVGLSLSNFTISIGKITLPYFSPSSTSFGIVYSYAGTQVAVVSSGVTVSVFCTSPCERCVSVQTACASCLPSPNTAIYLFTVNSSCLGSCPDGYYANNTLCVTCNAPCLYCLDSVNCSRCTNSTYLYGQACLAVCPPTYFGNSSNICSPCLPPCFNCTTATACTSCATDFFSNSSCVTAGNCPNGTFAEVASMTCAACSPPCAACNSNSSSCTACINGFVLDQNACPTTCPAGYYNSTNVCTLCVAPCGNCSSATFCLTCVSDYLSGGSCVTAASCPAGTYPNNASSTCSSCPSGCTTCSSAVNCTGCTAVYFFYNYSCVVSCPNTTYQSSVTCVPCSGCLTCSGSATSCLSCTPPLLLSATSCLGSCLAGTYSNGVNCVACSPSCLTCANSSNACLACSGALFLSGTACTSNCPTGTFQDVSSNNCTTCDPSCSACSLSSTNCTGCPPSKVMYQGSCSGSCPANYFNISGVCKTCSNCASCTSISLCAVCSYGYYMFNGVCYSACPLTAIADANAMTCTSCNPACATCSGTTTNCLSCAGGLNLLNGACYSSCPSGYIASAGECTKSMLGSIVYFPFSITFAVVLIIVLYSKSNHAQTESVTALCAVLALLVWLSWIVLLAQASNTDKQLDQGAKSLIVGICLVGVIVSIVLGLLFAIWFRH
jgi:hypothetical protein